MGMFADSIRRSKAGTAKIEDEALIKNATVDDLVKWMKDGVVEFEYRKKDKKNGEPGDIRQALGTKKPELVNKVTHGGICIPKEYHGYLTYFDLDKEDYRVFHPDRFVRVIRILSKADLAKEGITI